LLVTPLGAKKYKDLIDANEYMRDRIDKLCKLDRDAIKKEFDDWRIFLDKNIDDPLTRSRDGSLARTDFTHKTTQINKLFFNRDVNPSPAFALAHEFRHLSPVNKALPYDTKREITRQGPESLQELDAEAWAKKFMDDKCLCGSLR
jgi:hypothetical protein